MVHGSFERDGTVRAAVVADQRKTTLQSRTWRHFAPGAAVYTDSLSSYSGLHPEYAHAVIDHAKSYVEGRVHTTGIENFWSLLKRGLYGTYVAVAPFHLQRYIDEQAFRFNKRKGTMPHVS